MARRLKASDQNKTSSHKPSEVEVRNIAHPRLWQTAMKIAEGKRELITVESFTRLTIVN